MVTPVGEGDRKKPARNSSTSGVMACELGYSGIVQTGMNAAKSYEEIIDFIAAGTTPEAMIAFRPAPETQQRAAEVVAPSKDRSSSSQNPSTLDDYVQR